MTLKFISNPSKEVQKEAIINNPLAIEFIEDLDEELGVLAVRSLWNSLKIIKNPTERVIKEAIKTKGWAIQFVENPTEEMKILAVKKDYDAIKYIKEISEAVSLEAINTYWGAIRYIDNASLNVKIAAITKNEEAINYISNYDLDELKILIGENINVVKYVYDSIEPELVVEVLIEKLKNEDIDSEYMNNFFKLEILEMDKINFIREYGNKKAKMLLVDYKLSM